MFCSECGATITDGSRFCAACGATARVAPGSPPAAAVKIERPGAVSLLAVLKIVGAGLWLLLGLAWLAFLSQAGGAGLAILGAVGVGLGVACALCAYGLWTLRPWGRTLQIALSCLGLLAFPLTMVSVLILVYMFRPGVRVLFSGRPAEALTPEEADHVGALARSQMGAIITVAVALGFLVVPIAGIIAAIAIPNFLHAVDRGKQKRTMADIRSIAVGVEAYAVDHDAYPTADSADALAVLILPAYLPAMPRTDGWTHPLQVQSAPEGYVIYSFGKDGTGSTCDDGVTESFEDEICLADGEFIRHPQGTQQ